MQNRDKKKTLIETGVYEEYCKKRSHFFRKKEYVKMLNWHEYSLDKDDYRSCEQLRLSKTRQRDRVRERVKTWINNGYNVYFCTFTFNPIAMGRTEKTRRKYILNLLNNNASDYIASIDYGKHELEHYHALVVLKNEEDISYDIMLPVITDVFFIFEYYKNIIMLL